MRTLVMAALCAGVFLPALEPSGTAESAESAGSDAVKVQEGPVIERPVRPSPEAMFAMGLRYEQGDGVAQDYGKAFGWYRKAARLGLGRAQTKVGKCYEQGLGVRQDLTRARRWYERAIRHGDRQGGEEGMARLSAATLLPP